jgi:tungstate transport system ATP-binding protein
MKRTVFRNIAYGLQVRKDRGNWTPPVHDALGMVGLDPAIFAHRQWDALSGGEAQRVALAARLVLKPRVLLMDEPTASVDAASCELIRAASLRARSEWGATLVIASHDQEWLYDVCDEVIHLFKGKPVGTGRSNMIFGPWMPGENDLYYKLLDDGSRFFVSPPENTDATAFIDPAAIRILRKGERTDNTDIVVFDGTVTRLSRERRTGDLFADIRNGSLTLVVQVNASHLAAMTLHPGWPVTLAYHPGSIHWQ